MYIQHIHTEDDYSVTQNSSLVMSLFSFFVNRGHFFLFRKPQSLLECDVMHKLDSHLGAKGFRDSRCLALRDSNRLHPPHHPKIIDNIQTRLRGHRHLHYDKSSLTRTLCQQNLNRIPRLRRPMHSKQPSPTGKGQMVRERLNLVIIDSSPSHYRGHFYQD